MKWLYFKVIFSTIKLDIFYLWIINCYINTNWFPHISMSQGSDWDPKKCGYFHRTNKWVFHAERQKSNLGFWVWLHVILTYSPKLFRKHRESYLICLSTINLLNLPHWRTHFFYIFKSIDWIIIVNMGVKRALSILLES